jgi:tetratricopeptide (TPR) repeat protein
MFSELQSGEKNYIRLFDCIEKQQEFNEDEVKLQFAGEVFIQHLPSEKNFLYKTILKSLRQFHADNTSIGRLTQDIRNVQLLYQKGLFLSCKKALKRAKSTATDHEHLYHLHEILSWEKRLIDIDIEEGDFNSNLDIILNEEALVLKQLHNLAEYQILYTKINTIFRVGGFVRNAAEKAIVEEISNNYLITGKNTAISVNATSICYYIKGLCAATNRDYENAFLFFKKTKEVLDKNIMVRSELTTRYVQTIGHMIHCCFDSKNEEEANDLFLQLDKLKGNKDFAIPETMFLMDNIARQLNWGMLIREGKFTAALNVMDLIQSEETKYYLEKSREIQLVEIYHRGYAQFALGNFKLALRLVNDLLNDSDQRLRKDIFSYARILNVMIHIEMGNLEHALYVAKNTSKKLQHEDINYPLEAFMNRHLIAVSGTSTVVEMNKKLDALLLEIPKFVNSERGEYSFASLDIPIWAVACKQKMTINDIVSASLVE